MTSIERGYLQLGKDENKVKEAISFGKQRV